MSNKSKKRKKTPSSAVAKDSASSFANLYFALKHECILFCQSTTIRGLPRIVKTEDRNLRIIWISFVVTLFVGLLLSMIFLTRQYLEYSVIHPPVILPDKDPPFPSISVCNLRPLSRSGLDDLEKKKWRNPREFGYELNNYAANLWYYNESTKHYYTQLTTAISMNGYLESVPFQYLDTLGHSLNELVIYCMVIYDVGSKREFDRCENLGKWTKTIHALYLNCHSLTLDKDIRNSVRTVYMYLYLDDHSHKSKCADCFVNELKSQLSGALAVLHTPDTYPDINQEAVNLQPGTLTEFNLKFILHKNKRPPYGRCSLYTKTHIQLYNHKHTYSERACQLTTIQKEVNDICKCNVIEYPIFNVSLPFCSSMSHFIPRHNCMIPSNKNHTFVHNKVCETEMLKVFNNLGCKNKIVVNYRSDIVVKCTLPCSYYSYASERSTSTWPTKNFQLTWISSEKAKAIRNRPEFQPYVELKKLSDNGHEKEALEKLDKLNVLEKNLLGIMVNRPNNKVHVVEEKEVLSLTSYLSQIGGLCSVFIGLSMISVVELLELFIHFFEAVKQNRKRKSKKRKTPRDRQVTEVKLDLDGNANDSAYYIDGMVSKKEIASSDNKTQPPDYFDFMTSSTANENEPNDLWILQSVI